MSPKNSPVLGGGGSFISARSSRALGCGRARWQPRRAGEQPRERPAGCCGSRPQTSPLFPISYAADDRCSCWHVVGEDNAFMPH